LGIPHFLENRYRAGSHSFEIVKKTSGDFLGGRSGSGLASSPSKKGILLTRSSEAESRAGSHSFGIVKKTSGDFLGGGSGLASSHSKKGILLTRSSEAESQENSKAVVKV
jgi:hypothetical protein